MAKDMFWTSVTFSIIIAVLVLAFWPVTKGNVVVVKYDCSQPDNPNNVQEECKKRELTK